MKYCVSFLIFFFVVKQSYSTSIVIALKKDTFYVAADSKRTLTAMVKGKLFTKYMNVCKIGNVGTNYFAIAGHDDAFLHSMAKESIHKFSDINLRMKYFIGQTKIRYKKIMDLAKLTDVQTYNYYLKNVIGSVSFFGFKNGKPYLILVEFKAIEKGDVVIDNILEDNLPIVVLGLRDHIMRRENNEFLNLLNGVGNTLKEVENLVKTEIIAHPDKVGYPIDLIKLCNRKALWIQKKKTCTPYESPMTL